jgi:hypothetical protein
MVLGDVPIVRDDSCLDEVNHEIQASVVGSPFHVTHGPSLDV